MRISRSRHVSISTCQLVCVYAINVQLQNLIHVKSTHARKRAHINMRVSVSVGIRTLYITSES